MAGPDTNTNALPYPIWGFGPPSPEPDTKKLDALLASLNGSAERFQTLWFSFLGLTLYLAIAALATTHRDLLLNNPQTLPILNIKVELLPFYVIAPLLYLVFHFYLLMMLALLARTAAEFDKQLRTTLPDEPERERYRAQIGNALFLQLFVGMRGERTGVNAFLMSLIALTTIVLWPLATLVLMQMMFLPYHHLRITWWHRAVVVADFVLIVVMTYRCFFPRGRKKAPLVLGALSRKPRWATAMAFCVLLAVFLAPLTYWLSFQQGRWAGEPRQSSLLEWLGWMAGEPPGWPEVNPNYAATKRGVVFGLFPDRLKLANQTIVGKEKLEKTKEEIASRGGGLVSTVELGGRDLQAASLHHADLRGVSLSDANMRGASLGFARLDRALLDEAQLQGAKLQSAHLQGASLFLAQLQGADLSDAQLPGANIAEARLQGVDLERAQLQGADLSKARLEGADLHNAQLQGAKLNLAHLQGATLEGADLQGAGLSSAQLQGADLTNTRMADTDFKGAIVFRTNIDGADFLMSAITDVREDAVKMGEICKNCEPLKREDLKEWTTAATEFASEIEMARIVARFGRVEKAWSTGILQRTPEQVTWTGMQELYAVFDLDGAQHRRRLAAILGDLACGPNGAPHVARGLVGLPEIGASGRLAALGDQLEGARTRMREGRTTPDRCAGVAGFTEEDWRRLEAIKPD